MKNIINDTRLLKGLPKTSKYWQDWKKNNPKLSQYLRSVAIGLILGDVGLHKVGKEAYIKFEQGYKQKFFIEDLFDKFKLYTFMDKLGIRYQKNDKFTIKSYWFKTYSHETFTDLWKIFYIPYINIDGKEKYKKSVIPGLITKELDEISLAYWIMCDGSLQKDHKTLILHTQSFNYDTNLIISKELNVKFNLNSEVIVHKHNYYVIKIPKENSKNLNNFIKNHIIDSMKYKLPSF